jgi:tRNA(fMet)-specific endonuclease VapC
VQHVGSLHVSVVCVGELETWTHRRRASPQRDVDLDLFLRNVIVLPVTYEIACCFGDLRAELLDRGRPTPSADLFIAATALVHDLTLITHNV